ncbi:hypothetical protein BDN71DRAFT_1513162 [Pleurotus eryngii]|uniref:Uncharacterized protein n=1 Tax=Pleurotus eryngii TaxID=5323 RepID=A0A9P5ZHF3_PLEER|nr:hypothetical protein BDN71DRAFT_1513162 [Pleurotus eryngii]
MKNLKQPPAKPPTAAQLSNLKEELNVASRIAQRAQADVDIQKASVRIMQKTNAEILLWLTAFEKAARFLPKRPPPSQRHQVVELPATEMSRSPSLSSLPLCNFSPPLDDGDKSVGLLPEVQEHDNIPLCASPNPGQPTSVVCAQLAYHPPTAERSTYITLLSISVQPMVGSLTPEILIESPSRLTAYKDWEVHKRSGVGDGIVGAVIPACRQFITSPNASELSTPPKQTLHLILRKDGQLYQRQYCHYTCILKRIKDPSDPRSIMWWTLKEVELRADPIVPQRYSVEFVHLTAFKLCVSRLVDEFSKDKDSLRTEANFQWVNMLVNQLQLWVNHLSTFATIFQNVLFLVAEVQRRWLDLRAYIDYMVLVKKELLKLRPPSTKFSLCHPFIGAITYNHTVNEEFTLAGVPVWLLRDLSKFSSNVRIKNLAPLQETIKSVVIQPFPGISRLVFVGPSDSCLKHNTIYKYSHQHFSSTDESDFPLQSSFADVSASKHPAKRAKMQMNPSVSRSRPLPAPNAKDIAKFHPVDHPFWPAILPAWRDALAGVDHSNSHVVAEWKLGDSGYRFPDPHLFVPSTTNTVNKRTSSYYVTWLNYEDAICLAQSSPTSPCHTTSQWRELLLLSMKEAGLLSFKANSDAEGRMSEMTTLLQEWVAKHQIKMASPDAASANMHGYTLTLDALPPADVARMVVYVLCELNFRSELRALDVYMHIPCSSHRKAVEHDTLLGRCFPGWLPGVAGGDVLTVSEDDGLTGLCAPTFEDRKSYILALAQVMSSCGVLLSPFRLVYQGNL